MKRALTQAWWAPVAALLAAAFFVLFILIGLSSDDGTESRVAGAMLTIIPALAIVFGLARRARGQAGGSALVVVGGVFGLFWFWTIIPPILGTIVLIGVLVSALSRRVAK